MLSIGRREFITLAASAAVACPYVARARETLGTVPVLATWKSDAWQSAHKIALSPNGHVLLTAHWGFVVVWDVQRGLALSTMRHQKESIAGMAFLDNGRAVTANDEGEVIIWEIPSARRLASWDAKKSIRRLAVAPDGRTIATSNFPTKTPSDDDISVNLWNVATGELVWTRAGQAGWIIGVAYSPDGKLIAGGQKGSAILWDATTGSLIAEISTKFQSWDAQVWDVAFSPDSRVVAAKEVDVLSILDVASRQRIARIEAPAGEENGLLNHVAFLPNGRYFAVADRRATLIGELATNRFIATSPKGSETPSRIAISQDGTRAYVGLDNGKIQVLDLSSLR